jgi:tryptophanyl-tRNA synthetase
VTQNCARMPTDPARVRRTDAGDPPAARCGNWHEIYSNDEVRAGRSRGCRSAGIGCLDCKQPVIDAINAELAPMRERAQHFADRRPDEVRAIIDEGREAARSVARDTLTKCARPWA